MLMGKPEGRRPLRRPKRKYENHIKVSLTDLLREGTKWIYLAQDKNKWLDLVNTVPKY